MKKRVALFANGWVTENLQFFLDGLKRCLPKEDFADIYAFISYEAYGQPDVQKRSHSTVFHMPDLSSFDAAIVFYPGLNFAESINYIYDELKKFDIPVINICHPMEGFYNIITDNYSGMTELSNHLIEKHNCKKFFYVAGSPDNKDSNDRLSALRAALISHGYEAPGIYYSHWENGAAKDYIVETFKDRTSLPDAIVCANDHLAAYAVLGLEINGFKVPEDIIVTGFDHQYKFQLFYPSIATVDQNYDILGELSSKALVDIFVNDVKPYDIVIPSYFYEGESCGCSEKCDSAKVREQYTHSFPNQENRLFVLSARLFDIENTILYSDDYNTLKNSLHDILANHKDTDSYFFMMDPNFANIGKGDNYSPNTFNPNMDVIVSKFKGKDTHQTTCTLRDMVPGHKDMPGNHIYLITPYYLLDFVCGYLVFADKDDLIEEHILYDIVNRINRVLISLKHNLQLYEINHKLSELMEQDTLTRVKNRTAYDKYLNKLEQDFIEGENSPFAIIYFDINNLKMVNDMYGHEKGDSYIKNSCRLICNTFKHSPVFRIGGDEFVSVIINDDYTNRHELLSEMKEYMATLKDKGESVPLTERISIASGMAEYDRTLDSDFSSIFKRADELMYENKYKMKNEI